MEVDSLTKMTTSLLPVPKFADEAQERAYWETRDSTAHMDWDKAEKRAFPKLKTSTPASFELRDEGKNTVSVRDKRQAKLPAG